MKALERRIVASPAAWTSRIVGIAYAALWSALTYTAIFSVQGPPHPGLDSSWQYVLSYGAEHHLQWGRDVLFTYGPLGFLPSGSFLPSVVHAQLVYSFITPLIVVALTLLLARDRTNPLVVIPISIAVTAGILWSPTDAIFYTIVILGLGYAVRVRCVSDRRVALAFGLLASFGALIKVQFALDCALPYLVCLGFVQRDPRVLRDLAVWFGAGLTGPFVLFFDALPSAAIVKTGLAVLAAAGSAGVAVLRSRNTSGRSAAALGHAALAGFAAAAFLLDLADPNVRNFVATSLQLVSGYSSAMSYAGDPQIVMMALLLGAASIGLLIMFPPERRVFAAAALVILFLAFKHGFVRQDGHVFGYFGAASVVAAAAYALATTRVLQIGSAVLGVFAILSTHVVGVSMWGASPLGNIAPSRFVNKMRLVAAELAIKDEAGLERFVAPLRLPDPLVNRLQAAGRPVGSLPFETDIPLANGLQLAVAPVPQLYTAYTTELDEIDANWVRSSAAPQTILYQYLGIDGRYPFAETPAAYAALWCRYRVATSTVLVGQSLILLERHEDTCTEPVALRHVEVAWRAPISIPAAGVGKAIRVHVAMRRSVLGSLENLAFRIDPVMMRVTTPDGVAHDYRVLPTVAADGIIVEPLLIDGAAAARFFGAGVVGTGSTIAFFPPPSWGFQSTLAVDIDVISRS